MDGLSPDFQDMFNPIGSRAAYVWGVSVFLCVFWGVLFLGGLRVTNPPIRLMCPTSVRPSVCPSTFSFPDSNSKTLCPIEFKLDREIDHHHS